MLSNSAQKMQSTERRIPIRFSNPAHQLSANILASYLWRYLYLPAAVYMFLLQRHSGIYALRRFRKHSFPASAHSLLGANLPLKSF